jgi:hypothetical protein
MVDDVPLNEQVASFLLAKFPSTAQTYLDSDAHKLLDQLNTFYIRLNTGKKDSNLENHQYTIRMTHPVLEILSKPGFTPLNLDSGTSGNQVSPNKPKQKNRKNSRAIIFDFDEKPFFDIQVRWPRDQEEAHQLETDLLEERKKILEVSDWDGLQKPR